MRDEGYSMPEVRGQMIKDGIPTYNLGIQKTDEIPTTNHCHGELGAASLRSAATKKE